MISWAIETLIATSILMLVVLAIRTPVARYFGPHIAYGLWLLPAFRMILPPLPQEVAPTPLHMLPSPIDIELLLMAPIQDVAPIEAGIAWPLLVACLWGGGAVLFLSWHLLSYRRFVDRALGDAIQLPRLDRDGVEVCASPAARGPFAAGIFLKTIVLPEDYRRRYGRDELRLAIEHEVQHHRRCDMSANFVALAVLALHWWNPIAYFAHRAFRIDQELACDAMVLARATPAERHAYGSALLKSACDRLPVAACALGAGDDLKRRLTMMRTYRWSSARTRAGGLVAGGLVGVGLLLTASGGIAAETTDKVEESVRTVLADVDLATAPAAIAAAIAPAEAVAAPATPEPVELAMAMHPHPEAPTPPAAISPPTPPVAPAPPAPPSYRDEWIDRGEIDREVREALAEARREVAEAQREAEQDRREALREAEQDRREAMQEAEEARREGERARAEGVHARAEGARARAEGARARAEGARARAQAQAAARACPAAHNVSVRLNNQGGKAVVRCLGWSDKEKAEFRRTMIVSLQGARAGVASMDRRHMPGEAREQALKSIDQQIKQLRAGK